MGTRGILVALVLALAPILSGCTSAPEDADSSDAPMEAHADITGVHHFLPPLDPPDFTVTTIDGTSITLSQLEGQVVLVEFMGLGCSACRALLPTHKEIYEQYSEDPDFVFLALNAWHAWCGDPGCGAVGESEDDMRAYRDENGLGWHMATTEEPVLQAYGVQGTATHFFIDKEGSAHSRAGSLGLKAFQQELDHLLGQEE